MRNASEVQHWTVAYVGRHPHLPRGETFTVSNFHSQESAEQYAERLRSECGLHAVTYRADEE